MRPLCEVCNANARAVAYHKYGRVYYRSKCSSCIAKNRRKKKPIPRWQTSGYKKKPACDRCGFKARHHSQLLVLHVDGDLNNCELRNLRTVCLNCVADLKHLKSISRPGDLQPDS